MTTIFLKTLYEKQLKMLSKLERSNPEAEQELLEKLLALVERETVVVRQMLSERAVVIERESFFDSSADNYGISISKNLNNGQPMYIARLPFLLPNRRTAATDFKRTIAKSFRAALKKYCIENGVAPFDRASVTFTLFYKETVRQRPDADNIEISAILNQLTGLLIADDNSACCDLHILSRQTADMRPSFTQIEISSRTED